MGNSSLETNLALVKSNISVLNEQISKLDVQQKYLLKIKPKAYSISLSLILLIVPFVLAWICAEFSNIGDYILFSIPVLLIAKLCFRLYVTFKLQSTKRELDLLKSKLNDLIRERNRLLREIWRRKITDIAGIFMETEEVKSLAKILIEQIAYYLGDLGMVHCLELSIEINNTSMRYAYTQPGMATGNAEIVFAKHGLSNYNKMEDRQPVAQAIAGVFADCLIEKYTENDLYPDIDIRDSLDNPKIGYVTLCIKVNEPNNYGEI